MSDSDRIVKKVFLRAPKARVWRALTDAKEFGTWFRVDIVNVEGTFAVGEQAQGQITYPGYEHLTMIIMIERMDNERLFSFRWHPDEVDPNCDLATEPTTLVEFQLEEVTDGTMLTMVESGFDQLPPERRELAFRKNAEGWSIQVENIRRYVTD